MNSLVGLVRKGGLPALIEAGGPSAMTSTAEFFLGAISNANTRKAYARAVGDFLTWCEGKGVPSIAAVQPLHVSLYVRQRSTRDPLRP